MFKKSMYFFLGVLVLLGSAYAVRASLLLGKSKELVQGAIPFEKSVDNFSSRVLFAGDSTGVGVGSDSPEKTVAGYFAQDFPNHSLVNLSKSGRKTGELIPVLQSQADQSFDWVFIQIGGNDILYFTPQATLATEIGDVLSQAKRIGKHVILLTSGNVGNAPFFPRLLSSPWSAKTRIVRELFSAAAREHQAIYVDLYQEREDDVFLSDIPRFYSADQLHPSGDGYLVWYKQALQTLEAAGLKESLK